MPEPSARPALRCTGCGREPLDTFWQSRGGLLCADCRERSVAPPARARWRRHARAAAWGAAAAILGFLLYAGAAQLGDGELPLLAPVVGLGVGRAVRWGAGERTGRLDRSVAALLTYLAIVAGTLPLVGAEIVESVGAAPSAPAQAIALLGWALLVLASPFLSGLENWLGLAILALALAVAFRAARAEPAELRGPFRLA